MHNSGPGASHSTGLRRVAAIKRGAIVLAILTVIATAITGMYVAKEHPDSHTRVTDGYIPLGQSLPLTSSEPAVRKLDSGFLRRLSRAHAAALADGLDIRVASGWRSPGYQRWLMKQSSLQHGEREAEKLVQTPEVSRHTRGLAVDVYGFGVSDWLSEHGSAYGICQTYANETWHFEPLADPGGTCPDQLRDATAG